MKYASLQYQIAQLRQQKVIYTLESIAVFIFCFFLTAFLPQLALRYVLTSNDVAQQTQLFETFQVVVFLIGFGYFVFAAVGNVMRARRIKKLEEQMNAMMMGDSCCSDCGGMCMCDNHGNCSCGCDDMKKMASMPESMSGDAAAKMMMERANKTGARKKTAAKKK